MALEGKHQVNNIHNYAKNVIDELQGNSSIIFNSHIKINATSSSTISNFIYFYTMSPIITGTISVTCHLHQRARVAKYYNDWGSRFW